MFQFFKLFIFIFALLLSIAAAAPYQRQGQNSKSCMQKLQQNPSPASTGRAIYFLTNDAQNAVVALPIGNDGRVSKGTVTKTGGAGANSIDGATNQKAAPDALIGQSALTVVGRVSHTILLGQSMKEGLLTDTSHAVSIRSECWLKQLDNDGHIGC